MVVRAGVSNRVKAMWWHQRWAMRCFLCSLCVVVWFGVVRCMCVPRYGAIANADSCRNLDFQHTKFYNNLATEAGGVLYFRRLGNVTSCRCETCTMSGNLALGYGNVFVCVRCVRGVHNSLAGASLSCHQPTPWRVVGCCMCMQLCLDARV